MQSKREVNLREYKELIETIAKVEYQKLSSTHLIEYLELVNIGTQTLYNLCKDADISQFNNSYLSTAIKWAIRNEIRRRYKWYSFKQKRSLSVVCPPLLPSSGSIRKRRRRPSSIQLFFPIRAS